MRAERGFTAVEIVVVVILLAIVAALLGVYGHPGHGKRDLVYCQNHLTNMGNFLVTLQYAKKLRYADGAAFLLQVADQVTDGNLKIFICPSEPEPPAERPGSDTPEFVDMVRRRLPNAGLDDRMCSYAGPDWTGFFAGKSGEPRLWASDRCRGGRPHHEAGIVVLFANSAKVDVIATLNLEGHREGRGEIVVGPDSPARLLRTMTYYPVQR